MLYYTGGARFYGTNDVQKDQRIAREAWTKLIPYWEENEYLKNHVVLANAILGDMCFEGVGGPVDKKMGEKCLRAAMNSKPYFEEQEMYVKKASEDLDMYLSGLYTRSQNSLNKESESHETRNSNSPEQKKHHRIRGALLGLIIGGIIGAILDLIGLPGILCGAIVDIAVIIGIIKG